MNKAHKRMGMALILAIVALMMIPVFQPLPHAQTKDKPKTTQKRKKQQKKTDDIFADPTDMRPMTGRYYLYPSETKRKYPDLRKYKNVWFKVPISKCRAYVMSGDKVIYVMYASAGKVTKGRSLTPLGTFHVQNESGEQFINANGVGARYFISFYQHGVYLFHSVPINNFASGEHVGSYYYGYKNGAHLTTLGKKPDSHGCVRLTVSDAKWIYTQRQNGGIKVGTKVVIAK